MIKSFHNIKPVSGALVALIGLLFGLAACSLLYFFNLDLVSSNHFIAIGLGTLSIVLQALYFNKLCVDYDIIYTHTFIPAFFYVIIGCGSFEFIQIGIMHIYTWLFLLSLHQIIAIPNSEYPRRNIYSAAMLFGLISLLIPFYVASVFVLLLFILVFKTINFLDVVAVILGFALPLFVVASINLISHTHFNYYLIKKIDFGVIPKLGQQVNALLFPLAIFVMGAFRSAFNYFKNNVQTRKMLRTIGYIFIFHAIIILLNLGSFYELLVLMTIPFSVSFTYLHLGSKRIRLKSLSTILLLLSFLAHLSWQVMM